ncbi:sugar ABC transporter substrate-binding protein [Parablautia sp. Marseille-Q6255]|uniref:sugar ABC transporter substrate-binding protein n=1 Tax=Parablautia sp. Marseille-Q6255 TaxID=3039593 RepID=UPI0024BC7BEA|nr:sugar ABC transporter substrate-binding protein [Parablautia sp. Marseille-Q6255]
MNKKLASMLLAGTVIIASTMAAQAEEKTIAIVPWDISQAFAAQFAEVATEAIEANGWKAVTMDPKGDWASEYTIIENLITQQVDGIIYTAIDADGANDAVELCKEAGIPIVGYDCLASEGGEDAAVRYDDYRGGEMAAEQVMEALQGKTDAQIVVYEEEPSIASSGLRVNGFVEYMEANYPEVKIVVNRSADRTADGCYIWATDMITTYPDADAFFCWWNECTMATYNALQDAEKTEVYVIGYDAMEEQQNLMKSVGEDCKLYASPGMSAAKMANKCVEYMGQIFEGTYTRAGAEDICQMIPELLTVHNAQEFDIDK